MEAKPVQGQLISGSRGYNYDEHGAHFVDTNRLEGESHDHNGDEGRDREPDEQECGSDSGNDEDINYEPILTKILNEKKLVSARSSLPPLSLSHKFSTFSPTNSTSPALKHAFKLGPDVFARCSAIHP